MPSITVEPVSQPLSRDDLEAQGVAVERDQPVEIAGGDGDVVHATDHAVPSRTRARLALADGATDAATHGGAQWTTTRSTRRARRSRSAFRSAARSCPVHHHASRDFYTVARAEDITTILRSPQHVVEPVPQRAHVRAAPRATAMLLDADPPTHTWQRRLLQKAWTPRLITALEPGCGQRRRAARRRRRGGPGRLPRGVVGPLPVAHDRRARRGARRGSATGSRRGRTPGVEVTAGTPGAEAGQGRRDRGAWPSTSASTSPHAGGCMAAGERRYPTTTRR